jgi:hypothetical protein
MYERDDREFIARRMSDGAGSNRAFLISDANDWPRQHWMVYPSMPKLSKTMNLEDIKEVFKSVNLLY